MALSIRNERAEKLARELAELTGHNLTLTIIEALEEKLEKVKGSRNTSNTLDNILAISERFKARKLDFFQFHRSSRCMQ